MRAINAITLILILNLSLSCSSRLLADEPAQAGPEEVKVILDVSEVPELREWGTQGAKLITEWHPRLCNLLPTKGFDPPNEVTLNLAKSDEGVASTTGNVITVSSHWIEKHPEDIGLVLHELVHVIQSYPAADPWWVTEGIADYERRAIYEGRPQSWFPRPSAANGYEQGYNAAAGFLLWLEVNHAPGIVNKLNSSLRRRNYSDKLFKEETGFALEELWKMYTSEERAK